jgi:hypothetical protein
MNTELVKVDPKEYGLEEVQVATIEQAFLPKITERDGYAQIYEQLITKELTKELCNEARELRLKLVKTRTGIADIHKTQKAFFLAAGKFVDAWKNKETAPVEQMEEKLSEIEKHFENIEKERIAKLEADRLTLTKQFTEYPASNLGLMADIVFDSYLLGLKVAYEAKIKAEREAEQLRIDNERIDKLGRERISELYKYDQFQNDLVSVISMGSMSDENYKALLDSLKAKKITYEAEQERIRLENERLKAEAIEKERLTQERIAQEEKERKQKQAEFERKLKEESDKLEAERKRQAELIAKQKADADEKARIEKEKHDAVLAKERAEAKVKQDAIELAAKIEREKAEAERQKQNAILEKERQEAITKQKTIEDAARTERLKAESQRLLLEKEIQDKKDEETRKESERIAAEKAAAKAPDKEKLVKMVESILLTIPELNDATSIAVANVINAKFEAFKVWANSQINSL